MNDEIERHRAELEALADRFEALLDDVGIKIPTGSKLEQAMLLPRQLKYIRKEDAPLPELSPGDEDDMFRRIAWLWGIIPRVLDASRHKDFRELVPHLKLVIDGEFAQSVPGNPDEDSDKLFELIAALAVLPVAKNLRIDTGDAASRNPDLLFDFEGTRWGIACKALYTSKPERYRDSVIKGASQIERSEAARGVTDVCMEVGFSSLGSFSDLFRRRVGVSPSAYRRQLRALVQVPGALERARYPGCLNFMGARPPDAFCSLREA